MASDIDIASNALQEIGAKSISSFDDPGAGAAVAKALYERITRALLTKTYWGFALKKQQLNRLSQTPLNEFKYAHQIPTDCLKVQRTYPRIYYKIYRDLIYSDSIDVEIDYIFRVDTTLFPAYFELALTYKLASEFALAVTDNEQKNLIYEEKFRQALADAFAADAQQYPQRGILDSPFTDVRNGGGFGHGFGF
jgi:hypothetical protein